MSIKLKHTSIYTVYRGVAQKGEEPKSLLSFVFHQLWEVFFIDVKEQPTVNQIIKYMKDTRVLGRDEGVFITFTHNHITAVI